MENTSLLSPSTISQDLHIFQNKNKWIAFGKISGLIIELDKLEATIIKEYINNLSIIEICSKYNVQTSYCEDIISKISQAVTDSKVIISEVNPIESFLILVSEACNLNCSYCYGRYHEYDASNSLMNLDTIKRIMFVANELNIEGIGFFGGEPLLNFDLIKESVNFAQEKNYHFQYGITTNGTLLNDENADFLKAHNFNASIGLDGDEVNHNLTRVYKNGKGSYKDVLRGLKILSDRKILDAVEVTYSMKHSDNLTDIINAIKPYCNVITCSCVDGKKGVPWEEEIVSGERLFKYYDDIFDLLLNNSENDPPLYLGGSIELISNLLSPVKIIRPYICSGVMSRATITTNGNIYLCPETLDDEYCLGNIWDSNLSLVFENNRMRVLESLKKENIQNYWFSNIIDTCIVRLNKNNVDNKLYLENIDTVSKCFENIISKLTEIDTEQLMKNLSNVISIGHSC